MKRGIILRRILAVACLIGLGYMHGAIISGGKLLAQGYLTGTLANPYKSTIIVPSPGTAMPLSQTPNPYLNTTGPATGNLNAEEMPPIYTGLAGGPTTTQGIIGPTPTGEPIAGTAPAPGPTTPVPEETAPEPGSPAPEVLPTIPEYVPAPPVEQTPLIAMPPTNEYAAPTTNTFPPATNNIPGAGNYGVIPGTGTNGVPPVTPLQNNEAVGGVGNQSVYETGGGSSAPAVPRPPPTANGSPL